MFNVTGYPYCCGISVMTQFPHSVRTFIWDGGERVVFNTKADFLDWVENKIQQSMNRGASLMLCTLTTGQMNLLWPIMKKLGWKVAVHGHRNAAHNSRLYTLSYHKDQNKEKPIAYSGRRKSFGGEALEFIKTS